MSIKEVTGVGCHPGSSLRRSFCPQQRGRSAWSSDRPSSSGMIVTMPIGMLIGGVARLLEFRPELLEG
jgi:hypothetical protein